MFYLLSAPEPVRAWKEKQVQPMKDTNPAKDAYPIRDAHLEVLAQSPLFAHIAREDIASILGCLGAKEHTFPKRAVIARSGERLAYISIVLEGAVDSVEEDFWGNQVFYNRFLPGQTFGDAFVLSERESFPYTLLASQNTTVISLPGAKLPMMCDKACKHHQQLLQNMLSLLAYRAVKLLARISVLSKRTIREKLLTYLSEQALEHGSSAFTIDLNRQKLADYLAVDRSALSAELSHMARDGLLSYEKNSFILHQTFER